GEPVVEPDGEPVQINLGADSRVHIVVDDEGQTLVKETVDPAALTVLKTDDAGQSLAGACFALFGDGDDLVNQACDADDGTDDGSTLLFFPNGVDPGTLQLVETLVPEGQEAAGDQDVQVGPGGQTVTVQVAAAGGDDTGEDTVDGDEPTATVEDRTIRDGDDPTETSTGDDVVIDGGDDDDGGITLRLETRDGATGETVEGACFRVETQTDEVCDDDDDVSDGFVTLEGVEPGNYTVTETTPPDGYLPVGSFSLDVFAGGGEEYFIPHAVDPAAAEDDDPTETAAPDDLGSGTVIVQADDPATGLSLPGACFLLTNTESDAAFDACDDDDGVADGVTTFTGIPAGSYDLEVDQTPVGYDAPDGTTLTVEADQSTQETIAFTTQDGETPTVASGLGSLTIRAEDADGEPLPGAAYEVTNDAGTFGPFLDEDGDGVVIITEVLSGENTIEQVTAPSGQETESDESVEVRVGEEATVTFAHDDGDDVVTTGDATETSVVTETPAATGTADATETPGRTIRDPDGTGVTLRLESEDQVRTTVTGACYEVAGEGEACDDDDGDEDGFVTFQDIAPGTYEVTETRAPDGYVQIGGTFSITVVASEVNDFYIQHQADPDAATATATTGAVGDGPTGSLRISTLDGEGNPIEGACYEVAGDETVELCDGDPEDAEPQGGLIQVDDLVEGDYAVRQTDVPDDVDPAPDQTVSILGGQGNVGVSAVTELTVVNEDSIVETGSLVVAKVDEDSVALGGACFELVDPLDGATVAGETCDEDGDAADDGRTGFSGVPSGTYTLRETRTPDGYQTAGDQTVTIETGEVQVTSAGTPVPDEGGQVEIRRVGEDDGEISGACFRLEAEDGTIIGPVCDDEPGDDDSTNGTVVISDVAPGTYVLTESTTPDDVEPAAADEVEIVSGQTVEVEVQTDAVELPYGTLRIDFEDSDGDPVEGACVNVSNDAGEFGPFCDDRFDAVNDGTLTIPDVERGANVVSVITSPAGYTPAQGQDIREITVVGGEETTLTVTFDASFGTVRVLLTNAETGEPLDGACFTLNGPGSYGPACDGEETDVSPDAGEILFEDVATGTYTVTQTRTPDDFDQAGEASVQVLRDETVDLVVENVPTAPDPGSVEVVILDDEGDRLAGVCFGLTGSGEISDIAAVCDGEDGDDAVDDGVLTISGITPGDYTLTGTRTPDGFVAVADQPVTIEPGTTTRVEVRYQATPAETGSIVVRATGPDGEPVAGACFTIATPRDATCDGDDDDAAPEDGAVRFDDLAVGDYVVLETDAPDGLVLSGADRQDASVTGGEVTEVTFDHEAAPAETGGIRVLVEDDGGDAVEGACFRLAGEPGEFGPICDNGEDDGDDTAGVVLFEDVPVGSYQVIQDGGGGFAAAEARSVTAVAGVTVEILIIIIIDAPDSADLLVTKLNERGQLLGGSCFALVSGDDETEICDGDANDADGTTGEIRFDDLPAGGYVLVESRVPEGYQDSGDQDITIEGGGDGLVTITVVNQPIPDVTGDVVVLKVDAAGDRLGGACFALLSGAVELARACDEDGDVADDGRIGLIDIAPGTYTLREVRRPSTDYARAGDQTVTVTAGGTVELTVENRLRPATLVIEKVDPAGDRLTGACFTLAGTTRYERCDDDDPAGDDGEISFAGIVPGDYALEETVAPAGYAAAADQDVTLDPGQRLVVPVENVPLPPPVEAGDLVIAKVGPDGAPLAGACFALLDDDRFVYGPRCDASDGAADGTISFAGVAAGDYTLRETRLPSADFQAAADRAVTVIDGEATEIVVENVFKRGRVLVRKVNAQGHLLQGACFDLSPDGGDARCTAASGTVVFSDLEPGTYSLDETQAPAGYLEAETVEGINVEPGATTVITVEDESAPPPPNTGSLQVFTFYCPAGSTGERTIIFDSSDGDASQLARTSDCSRGAADFTLRSPDGDLGEVTFSTGDDGTYARGLDAGTYVLREVAPDLAGDASETFGIAANQLTTIVVINEVAPPAPAPVTVNVVKYTCEPGFAGTIYADFVDNCAADAQRTNNVTFRVSGPVAARGITGDGGTAGVTTFARVPAGTYTLSEDVYDLASSVYSFCGLDPAAPAIRSFGAFTGFTLAAGTTMTCAFFNVPDDLTETTGAILVHKFTCPVETPPAGYDFEESCTRQATAAQFSLGVYSAEMRDFVPRLTGYTNVDGVLRISRLQPGLYELTEIGDSWCYAESDNVNRDGDLIVEAGERTEVFIYNCSPVEREPNTGTGTAAGSVSRRVPGGAGIGLALIGSGMALAVAAGLRRRSLAA
ncbi:MAG: SpaA isopeptide-forming pilin-related protein, partial [Thermomicrobiales bacterium]